jgi:hypothetical protein
MTYDVLVTREKNKRFKARVLLVVTGDSEAAVLEWVQTAISDLRASSHMVRLDLPLFAGEDADPWLRYAGLWANDPNWDVFQAGVGAFRQAIDAQS